MNARENILSAIKGGHKRTVAAPPSYCAPTITDPANIFAERARLANAEVRFIDAEASAPAAIVELLRARNLPAIIHVPPDGLGLPWDSATTLTVVKTAPGPEDTAVAIAPYGIAETGTLAYFSHANGPASWHFRAGFEVAVVRTTHILSHMEDVITKLKSDDLPSTVNFVTGPSRTGDIEQTLEIGAHGPKALAIFIVQD